MDTYSHCKTRDVISIVFPVENKTSTEETTTAKELKCHLGFTKDRSFLYKFQTSICYFLSPDAQAPRSMPFIWQHTCNERLWCRKDTRIKSRPLPLLLPLMNRVVCYGFHKYLYFPFSLSARQCSDCDFSLNFQHNMMKFRYFKSCHSYGSFKLATFYFHIHWLFYAGDLLHIRLHVQIMFFLQLIWKDPGYCMDSRGLPMFAFNCMCHITPSIIWHD